MKKLLIFAFVVMAIATARAQETAYKISGTAPEGITKVYLRLTDRRQVSDSAAVSNGKFELSGKLPLNSTMIIAAGEYGVPCFNDGTPMSIDFTNRTVKASPLNMKLHEYDKQLDKYYPQLEALYMSYDSVAWLSTAAAKKRASDIKFNINAIQEAMMNDMKTIVAANKDNLIPVFYISQILYAYDYDELNKLLDPSAPYYNHPSLAFAKKQLVALAKRKPGKMFMDLTINDISGKPRKLSEWCGRGNHVLIDFWASWCGPCRAEMPNVVENYAKYHAKGFEIIGVSFDSKADAWKNAVQTLGMVWPQLSDLRGWKSESASLYGITAIPANVLLDKDGKIIAVDLTGDELGEKLKELYGF